MAKVVALLNQKGGVGKTTTTLECIYQAGGRLGKRCLVVDLDAQANATKMLTGQEGRPSLYDAMIDEGFDVRSILKPATEHWPNTLVLPADSRLGVIEPHLLQKLNRERILKTLLMPIREHFDLILIDLPPTINTLTVNALVAADAYLVPSDLSQYAKAGINMVKGLADRLRDSGNNPSLEFVGIVLTSFQKGGAIAVRQLVDELTAEYGDKLLPVRIPDSVKVTESQAVRRPAGAIDPESSVAKSYEQLVGVLL